MIIIKTSNYNLIYKKDDITLLYNFFSQAMAYITLENIDSFEKFINEGKPILDTDFLNNLKMGGFIIDKNINELEKLKDLYYVSKKSKKTLRLTIAPTLKCNFSCPYCFENDKNCDLKMNDNVQFNLIQFVRNEVENNCVEMLEIIWYGGEPLIEYKTIEKLSAQLLEISNVNNIKYSSSIITNGYLLNSTVLKCLIKSNIKNIQITLDGNKTSHDKLRPLKGGSPTFDKIYNNIVNLLLPQKKYFDEIKIRINASHENEVEAIELSDELLKLDFGDKLHISYAKLENSLNIESNINYFNNIEFAHSEFNFNSSIYLKKENKSINEILPFRVNLPCIAINEYSFVVDSVGNFYSCLDTICDNNYIVKSLLDKNIYDNCLASNFNDSDPFLDNNCSQCKFLPVCLGGCPKNYIKNGKRDCTTFKYNIDSLFEFIIKNEIYTN